MRTHVFADGFDPGGDADRADGLFSVRRIGVDEWSAVRYVHAMSFRTFVAPRVTYAFTEQFMARLNTPTRVDELIRSDLSGAWIDQELAGTVGWRPLGGGERVAVIEDLYVSPLFAFLATVPLASASFLTRFGYEISAQLPPLGEPSDDVPVFVMGKRDAGTMAASDDAAEEPQPQFEH